MSTKPVVAVNATYTVHPDDVPAFSEIARKLAQAGRASAGCVYFQVAQDVEDISKFHLLEGWTSEAAAGAFNQSDAFKELLSRAMSLRLLGRSGLKLDVSNAEPLAMPS